MYNLKNFGIELRHIRNNLKLTQKRLYELSGIHMDTLRKIENGKVIPTQETLDLLSVVLNKDLNKLLLDYRYNYSDFKEISNRVEYKLDIGEYDTLSVELEDLRSLLNNNNSHQYFINFIKQLILLIDSMLLNNKEHKLTESLNKLIVAMQVTTKNFTIDNYKDFVYSSMELRILMNIALLLDQIESTDKGLELMEFCMQIVDPQSKIFAKISYNLSYLYYKLNMHEKALEYSNQGINHCNITRNYNGLHLLYYIKGIAEYFLKYDSYIESLRKSINFCEILGHNELRNHIIDSCNQNYRIYL